MEPSSYCLFVRNCVFVLFLTLCVTLPGSTVVPPWADKPFDPDRPYSYTTCVPCNVSLCGRGQYRMPCNTTRDSFCVPCDNTIPANSQYIFPGDPAHLNNCAFGCNNGYYKTSAGICLPCNNIIPSHANYNGPGTIVDLPFCPWACPANFYANGMACELLPESCPAGECPYPQIVTYGAGNILLENP